MIIDLGYQQNYDNSIGLFQTWLISPNIRQTGVDWTQGLTDVGSEEGMGWQD